MNDEPNLLDDEVLLGALGDTLDATEPLDDDVVDAVVTAAFSSRDLAFELAELLSDSALSAAGGTRSTGDDRQLSYSFGDTRVDLDLQGTETVVGLIAPVPVGEVTLDTAGRSIRLDIDEFGRFTVRTDAIRFRLVFAGDADARIVTPWAFR